MRTPPLDWAVASRTLRGETVSGDQHLVLPFPDGVLVAVIDGLGHGPVAEAAARTAIDVLSQDPSQSVAALMTRCDRALGRLRGVVMSLASFEIATGCMTWLGIGNVEAALVRLAAGRGVVHEHLLLRGGIVGQSLGRLRPASVSVGPGDLIVFATDGIDTAFLGPAFVDEVSTGKAVETIANHILERHAQDRDDALVLVARYRGGLA